MLIVETRAFTRRVQQLWDEESYRELQIHLAGNPKAGAVIRGTGGLRKLRWSGSGRGKRGGTRVIYFWHTESERLLMLFLFAKKERGDLSAKQRKTLKKIVEMEFP